MKSYSDSYKAAGVDVTAGYEGVRLMTKDVERTNIPGVLTGIGGFGGLFQLDIADMKEPVLVSGTDGVGTKLKLAFLMDKHDTVGIDCVVIITSAVRFRITKVSMNTPIIATNPCSTGCSTFATACA